MAEDESMQRVGKVR